MKTVNAFQTSDGSLFSTLDYAEKHEMTLLHEAIADSFLESDLNPYTGHAHRAMARNTIFNWEIWKFKNEIIIK
jgi:hypothetical protein